jgi:hypothetical protein
MVLDPRVEKLYVCVKRRLASFKPPITRTSLPCLIILRTI